jgi:branched-chain amino acid transport system permease protein
VSGLASPPADSTAAAGARHRRPAVLRPAGATRAGLLVLALAAVVIFPLAFTNQQVSTIAFLTLIFVCAAAAWNLFSGYSGYISLGHAVFFGSGAYAAGIAARDWQITGTAEFALLPLAAVVAALIAVPFGLIALRVRRHTFVVITIAIFFIFQLMAFNLNTFTNGTSGLDAPFLLWDPVSFDQRFYYMALALALGTVAISWLIKGSRFGLQLRAIRDDEDRAASLGVRAMPVKLTAFVISGAITGLAGALWFFFINQVLPQSGFDPLFDLTVALMAFLGGLGTVSGPLLGALIIEPAQQYLTTQFSNSYLSQILLGALFLAVVLFLPRGLIPTAAAKGRGWLERRRGRQDAAAQAEDDGDEDGAKSAPEAGSVPQARSAPEAETTTGAGATSKGPAS